MGRNKAPIPLGQEENYKELAKRIDAMRPFGYHTCDNFAILMELMAIGLSNIVKHPGWEERERQYLQLVKTIDIDAAASAAGFVMDWFTKQPEPIDLLGPFHTWVGMDNAGTGQFFTPWHVSVMMAKMQFGSKEDVERQIKAKGYIAIADPTCGAGGMLVAAANALSALDIDPQKAIYYGTELMPTTAYTAFVQCALYGLPAVIQHGDSLRMQTYQTFATVPYWGMMSELPTIEEQVG